MTESPAPKPAWPAAALYQIAADGAQKLIGNVAGQVVIEVAGAQEGHSQAIADLARGFATLQCQFAMSAQSLRRLAAAMERYDRRLTLRRQAIAKARGRGWRSIRGRLA